MKLSIKSHHAIEMTPDWYQKSLDKIIKVINSCTSAAHIKCVENMLFSYNLMVYKTKNTYDQNVIEIQFMLKEKMKQLNMI